MAYAIDDLDLLNDEDIAPQRPMGIASLDQDYPAVHGQARRRPTPGIAGRALSSVPGIYTPPRVGIGAGIDVPPASPTSRPNQQAPIGGGIEAPMASPTRPQQPASIATGIPGISVESQNQREINRLPPPNAFNAEQNNPALRSEMADQAIANVDRIAGIGGSVEAPQRYTDFTPSIAGPAQARSETSPRSTSYAIGEPGIGQPFGARLDNGFSAPDMENINARIRGIRDNPQAIAEFNNAQRLNRTGIQVGIDGGVPTFSSMPGAQPRTYTGADGKPTPNWNETEEYQSGVARATADRAALSKIEDQRRIEDLTRQASAPLTGSFSQMRQAASTRRAGKLGLDAELRQRETESRRLRSEQTGRHLDRRQTEIERHNRAVEDTRGGGDTSMMKNIDFMVKSGIAKDPVDAHSKLRTAMGKSDEDAVLSLAGSLMRGGGGYFGKNGYERAVRDATAMVQSVRGADRTAAGTPPPGQGRGTYTLRGKTFTDADINATAQKHGMTPDQVKQRLGIQ